MTVRIRAIPRGPLVVEVEGAEGDVELRHADGRLLPVTSTKVRFCRCGATGSAPLCDGSHNRTSFERPPSDDEPSEP